MNGARLVELIERLGSLLWADRQHLPANLRPVHLRALNYLDRCNRYSNTPAALARYLGATRGTTSQSIAVLERRKLVRRTTDPQDARVIRLHLTGRAERLLRQDRDTVIRKLERWENVAIEDLAAAVEVLEQLLRHLQRQNDYRTFGLCRTCRHLLLEGPGKFRCGLTLESLAPAETEQICHEHQYPAA